MLAATCISVAPPFDTHIAGADSAGYLASGVHLARHGSLIIHDPTLPLLSADLKRLLFPSVVPDRGSPPYLRLPGSLVLRSLDTDEVLPAFHHLIAVWIAVAATLAGADGAQWAITVFAGLSMWAMLEFAAVSRGAAVAAAFCALMLLLSPQYWYSRFLMPEVPGQFFVWSGLALTAIWQRSQRRADAILAGISFGLAGLMRIENAAFLLLALPFARSRRAGTSRAWLLGCASALWLHAVIHLTVFRTHYLGILQDFLMRDLPAALGTAPSVLIVVAAAGAILLAWRRPALARRWRLALFFVLIAAIGLWADYRHQWPSVQLLRHYAGIPTLLAGAVGLLLACAASDRDEHRLALFVVLTSLAGAQFLLAPHATRVPIWVIRRAVTVLLPALCFSVVLLADTVRRRAHWSVALLVLAVALAGQLPSLLQSRREGYYGGTQRHLATLATLIPPRSRLLYDAHLTGSGIPQSLWAEYDLPAYLMADNDFTRIHDLVNALAPSPVFWVNNGASAPPHGRGIAATPIALYEFALTTPALDVGSAPGASTHWDYTIGLYALRAE